MGHPMTRVALAVVIALLPVLPVADAQPAGKVYRIAFVHPSMPVADMIKERERSAFLSELRRLGYVEGKNLIVERRSAEGRIERQPDFVAEVIHLKPDLVVAITSSLVRRFRTATTAIPIVGLTGDPLAGGLVANLSGPAATSRASALLPAMRSSGNRWSCCERRPRTRRAWPFSFRATSSRTGGFLE